jgi:hypothetical protein
MIPNVMNPADLVNLQQMGSQLMQKDEVQKLGQKPNTPKNDKHTYKVIHASRVLCQCQHRYSGISSHKFYQFNTGNEPRLPPGTVSSLTLSMPLLDQMTAAVDNAMTDRFQLKSKFQLPSYVLVHEYQTADNSIGYHSDADPICHAMQSEAVIFSFNFHRSGMFAVQPMSMGDRSGFQSQLAEPWLSDRTQCKKPAHMKKWGHIVIRYVPENSVVIMGGHFQSQMVHASLSHKDILIPAATGGGPEEGFWQEVPEMKQLCEQERQKYLACDKQGLGGDVDHSRKVFTYRFVNNHMATCPYSIKSVTAPPPPPFGPPPRVDLPLARLVTLRPAPPLQPAEPPGSLPVSSPAPWLACL